MTFASAVYGSSFIPSLSGVIQLFSGNYGRYGLPYGFIGEWTWFWYSSYYLPLKVPARNGEYLLAQVEANLQQTYFFIINYPYTVFLKLTTPEVFEFDMEEIKTRGYGLTVAEATAIRYWGEENNTADKQDIVWLLAGYFFNGWTFSFLAP